MDYINRIIEKVRVKDHNEKEFIQAAEEVLESLAPVVEKHPEIVKANILERIVEPER